MSLKEVKSRWKSETPVFWKKIQKIGIIAGTIGGALLTAPISLPTAIVTGATYLVIIGTTTATLSQLTKE